MLGAAPRGGCCGPLAFGNPEGTCLSGRERDLERPGMVSGRDWCWCGAEPRWVLLSLAFRLPPRSSLAREDSQAAGWSFTSLTGVGVDPARRRGTGRG